MALRGDAPVPRIAYLEGALELISPSKDHERAKSYLGMLIIGSDQRKETPDLVIEVVWTSGGIDKLEIYRRLGIGEVWFWKDGRLAVYVLCHDQYERVARSVWFPDLDLDLVCALLDRPTAVQAVRALRDTLRR